ncbi:protein phosphatase [Cognatiyoonia sp. IB215446]|uniref:protein-tyrosine phosphatase family protein n=1 Tax=Cognatiyoonia sp. IB215446 TaxID=3097355 RepID=UPI002A14DCA4|nr:protein-tyrosine phosphatase family protein [Cognatiyoonia sp. IB215446]MDX8347193.1 protein phosphatase [Cognatiyoonia sp. IB215446]
MALSEFVINSLPVGGGELAITPIPGRTRHYYTDWLRLIDWQPAMVISMTAQAELDRKGAGTLGTDLANEGVMWWHCPVPDFNVPDGTWDWNEVRTDALAILARGERVLVHCFGGCGRSGMMCLRLMIAAGEGADAALARLRAIRPCAVETEAQLAWAQQG